MEVYTDLKISVTGIREVPTLPNKCGRTFVWCCTVLYCTVGDGLPTIGYQRFFLDALLPCWTSATRILFNVLRLAGSFLPMCPPAVRAE